MWYEGHGLEAGPRERVTGCPSCRGAYEPAARCACCGGWAAEEELLAGGLCRGCAEQGATPERVEQYVRDRGLERDFYVTYWYENEWLRPEELQKLSRPLLEALERDFHWNRHSTEAQRRCRAYAAGDLADFAAWLEDGA